MDTTPIGMAGVLPSSPCWQDGHIIWSNMPCEYVEFGVDTLRPVRKQFNCHVDTRRQPKETLIVVRSCVYGP